ncbi:hypothetical protein HMPREF1985_02148 [Mitsuokella sp. oral taxon 131 str. W9106]|nr:hypothetical protein HMPREF1985_02148 [Mitsuokella sp. oral taxon 131 str. W9106]
MLEPSTKFSVLTILAVVHTMIAEQSERGIENDTYEAGCPLYHVERIIEKLQRSFDDGAHILYVNGANRDDTPLVIN